VLSARQCTRIVYNIKEKWQFKCMVFFFLSFFLSFFPAYFTNNNLCIRRKEVTPSGRTANPGILRL
jgi:hypothetical protein